MMAVFMIHVSIIEEDDLSYKQPLLSFMINSTEWKVGILMNIGTILIKMILPNMKKNY